MVVGGGERSINRYKSSVAQMFIEITYVAYASGRFGDLEIMSDISSDDESTCRISIEFRLSDIEGRDRTCVQSQSRNS